MGYFLRAFHSIKYTQKKKISQLTMADRCSVGSNKTVDQGGYVLVVDAEIKMKIMWRGIKQYAKWTHIKFNPNPQ